MLPRLLAFRPTLAPLSRPVLTPTTPRLATLMSGSFPRLAQRTPDSVDSTTTTTAGPENPAAVADVTLPKRASSLVSSILHGSPKAKQEARDTFSRLLARGKYVHEICEHSVKPDCHDEYVALISDFYPRLTRDMNPRVKLCGSWQTDVGRLDNFVHIWEYEGYPAHGELLHQLKTNSEYLEFQRHCMKLLARRNSQIMLEFAFWPTSPPVTTHGVYELRSYRLKPGNLLEWESNWRKGIECRKGLEHPIGAWFSQLGGLNQVHHMWAYPDLETRKRAREEAWSNDAWAQTVYNTVRLIDEMHASILSPLPFSPLK